MAKIRYRGIIKVSCEECSSKIKAGKKFDIYCTNDQWLKYNNINNLLSFTNMLDKDHPRWIFWNLYEYIKGQEKGRKLITYTNGKNRKVPGTTSI